VIEFNEFKNTKKCFGVNESEIKVFVNVKNVSDLVIKAFEINTKSYSRDKLKPIETDMNLDGLNASFEYLKTNEEIGIKNSYHKRQISVNFPKPLLRKREVYFLDILSQGRHARCVLKIGYIRYVTRVTEAGHLFQLLDETNEIISNASIFMSGHSKHSNAGNGEIFIPLIHSRTDQTRNKP